MRGSDNPFRDVGLPDADTELIKADLAAVIIKALRERGTTGSEAAAQAAVREADITAICRLALDRFTIDRLVQILNRIPGCRSP